MAWFWVLLRTYPHRMKSQRGPWDKELPGFLIVQESVRRYRGRPCLPGTDLEPPRAGKDPDLRPEEMLLRSCPL